MNRLYKLAANFNSVEFAISDEMIEEEARSFISVDDDFFGDGEIGVTDAEKTAALSRILQREYDVIANIKVVGPVAPAKSIAPNPEKVPPSEKQAKWAEALGMKNPLNYDKAEVWEYIKTHRNG